MPFKNKHSKLRGLFIALVLGCLPAAWGEALQLQFRAGATNVLLRGKDAAQQIIATIPATGGAEADVSRNIAWKVEPAVLATVDATGRVTPLANGRGTISATLRDGTVASLPLVVENAETSPPINFVNQIVPVFTKNGCNGGGCHGKAAGQNGFRLSLLGFEPAEDFDHLVKEARGRRLFPASPERSLLLTKGTALLPHGGGKRLEPDSDDYKLLVRWITQGMPYGKATDPGVTRIEVFPTDRTMPLGAEQQLVVSAYYSDGTVEDVTRGALFEPNDKDMAKTDSLGRVKVFDQPGEVAVMVRYQGKVCVFRGTVPLGAPIAQLPPVHNFVDELVFKQLKKVGMPPSDVCDDLTFIRRVTVDLAGRTPTEAELDAFQKDPSVEKRGRVIDRLLASGDYADYFANKWSALLRNKRTEAKQARGTFAFYDWIRESIAENKPYDQFVREILTASGDIEENPAVAWYRQVRTIQNQLEDTAQLFLGLRMQCAQCHHHPYEKWSQADYWSFGAFFSQVSYKKNNHPGEEAVFHRRGNAQATNKKNGQAMKPAGLGETVAALAPDDDPRQALADWISRPDNRFFSRALVNRYWKHFFNRGLVDPEDDMRETNPPTNPELLDALSANFVKNGYDLKWLVRTLTTSSVYQLSAVPNQYNARDRHHFARYYPRRLGAEVLYDTVNTMLLSQSKFDGVPVGTRAVCLPDNSFNANNYFLTVFGRPDSSSACECERSMDASLSQSLHLLNAKDIQDRLGAEGSRAAQLALDTKKPDEAKLREIYRVAYSREPQADELKFALDYLGKKSAAAKDETTKGKARREAYEDMVWALLNTKEFLFNH